MVAAHDEALEEVAFLGGAGGRVGAHAAAAAVLDLGSGRGRGRGEVRCRGKW